MAAPARRHIKHAPAQKAIHLFYMRQHHMPVWARNVSKRNLDKFCTLVEALPAGVKAMKLFKYSREKHGALRGVPMPPGWAALPLEAAGELVRDGVWFVLDPSAFGKDGPGDVPAPEGVEGLESAVEQEPQQLESGVFVLQLEYVLYKLTPVAKGSQLNIVDETEQRAAFQDAVYSASGKAPRRKRRRQRSSGSDGSSGGAAAAAGSSSSSSSGDSSSSDDDSPQRRTQRRSQVDMAAISDMIDQKITAPLNALVAAVQQSSTNLLAVFHQLLQQGALQQAAPQQPNVALVVAQLLALLAQQPAPQQPAPQQPAQQQPAPLQPDEGDIMAQLQAMLAQQEQPH